MAMWRQLPRLWLLGAAHYGVAGDKAPCTLVSMWLRYGYSPIDLEPPFRPFIFSYTATLDFSMDSCSVGARPDTGCQVEGVPSEPTKVQIGGSTRLVLYAKHPTTGEEQAYTVTLSRLFGSETELKSLAVQGGQLSPVFNPDTRSYTVQLDLSQDEIRVVYRLWDNEQRITGSAKAEYPTGQEPAGETPLPGPPPAPAPAGGDGGNATSPGSNSTAAGKNSAVPPEAAEEGGGSDDSDSDNDAAGEATADEGRRLQVQGSSGEAEFQDASMSFLLDVGFTRSIQLTVQGADPTQANIGAYRLDVFRPACTLERPYFDPQKRFCVDFCPSGFYRNDEVHRCSKCNSHCRICDTLLHCQMCEPNSVDYSYSVQSDGRCEAVPNHLFKKYMWWCLGLAVLFVLLMLIGCFGLCQLCCMAGSSESSSKGRYVRAHDSDSDEPLQEAQQRRRLAMY